MLIVFSTDRVQKYHPYINILMLTQPKIEWEICSQIGFNSRMSMTFQGKYNLYMLPKRGTVC
jgi:hypothetical protein